VHSRSVALRIRRKAKARASSSVLPRIGTQATVLRIGKKSVFSVGTVQVLTTVLPKLPARNQTGPDCASAQNWPVVSATGLRSLGTEAAHSHQARFHSPYDMPWGLACGGRMPGFSFRFPPGPLSPPSADAMSQEAMGAAPPR